MDDLKKLYIEPTSNCNLRCEMCFRNSWVGETPSDMDGKIFDSVLNGMPQTVETLFFGGMGEPLFHPEIVRMVRRAAGCGVRVELITNATLLTCEMSHALLEAGLSMLWLSLESFDAQAYGAIRRNGDLARVLAHLDAFNEARTRMASGTKLGVNFVAMARNVQELALIPRFIRRYDVNEVNISNLIPSDRESESQLLYKRIVDLDLPRPDKVEPVIRLPMMDWERDDVMEGVRRLFSTSSGALVFSGQPVMRKINSCRFIEEGNAFVRADGDVSPCMALLHGATMYWGGKKRLVAHHAFGSVVSERLADIWSAPVYSAFRDRVRRFDFSPCIRCSGCDYWDENCADCFGNEKPVCGGCLWPQGVIRCP